MATVLKSDKDAVKYVRKLLLRYPDGILVIGPPGAGKTTLLHALLKGGIPSYDGDKAGKVIGTGKDAHFIVDWKKIPAIAKVVAAIPWNLDEYPVHFPPQNRAVLVVDPVPARWVHAMKLRGDREKHAFTEEFRRNGLLTPSQARKHLGADVERYRKMMPEFGDRVFTVRTSDWPGYQNSTGRAWLKD